jgi:hypothetical protein
MVSTTAIIEGDRILILWLMPQIQITIGMIVSVWLAVPAASEPPSRAIRCPPRLLLLHLMVHRVRGTSTATILRAGDINDPMGMAEGTCRVDKGLPILTGSWREDFGAIRATVFILCSAHVFAICAFYHWSRGVGAVESETVALASLGASFLWLR